jgi:Trk K+ transport system NAD-binding subunit
VAADGDGQPVIPVIVAGLGPLGLAIVERLVAAGTPVHAVVSALDGDAVAELNRLGVRAVTGSPGSPRVLEAAGLASASVVVLAADDDAGNVDAALLVRRQRADLPLVVRIFDPDLSAYLRDTVDGVTVLSMSALGAPRFAELALEALAPEPAPVRPHGRTRHRRRWGSIDRIVLRMLAGLVLTVVLSALYFTQALGLRFLDALYFVWTTVTTVGYGDIALRDAPDTAKLVGMGVMFAGAAFIAALYAVFTGSVVARRLDALRGRIPVRGHGHLVVAGAGHVGLRVTRILADQGHRVVVVERDGDNRHVSALRAEGHHVIVADATGEEILDLARVEAARAVLALTDSDGTNLHIALAARRRNPAVPVVVRLASPELSAHVAARHDALAASSLDIAGEAFARAALAASGAAPSPKAPA